MAALRLTTATLCSSKQITKVFQSNLRILSSRGYKVKFYIKILAKCVHQNLAINEFLYGRLRTRMGVSE